MSNTSDASRELLDTVLRLKSQPAEVQRAEISALEAGCRGEPAKLDFVYQLARFLGTSDPMNLRGPHAMHDAEHLEAMTLTRLDSVLSGQQHLSLDPKKRRDELARFLILGHIDPLIGDRLRQEDARAYLASMLSIFFDDGRPPA